MDQKFLKFLSAIFVLIALVVLVNRLLLVSSYYPELGGIEETFIYFIQKLSLHIPFYDNPERPPYNFCQYAPGYFLLMNSLSKIFHIDPLANVHQLYILCRSVNLCLNIFSACLTYYLLRQVLKSEKPTSIIFSSLSFCLNYVHQYSARPDSLKNTIFILILILAFKGLNSGKTRLYLWTAVLAFAAILVKQDGVLYIPALLIFYWLQKDYKGLKVSIVAFFCMFICSIVIVINYPRCYEDIISGLNQGISFPYLFKMYKYQLIPRFLFLLIMLIFTTRKTDKAIPGIKGLGGICVIMFIGASLTSLKWGSTPVYYSEFFQAFLVFIGINFNIQIFRPSRLQYFGFALLPIFLFTLLIYESTVGLIKIFDTRENFKCKADYQLCKKIAGWIRSRPKRRSGFDVISFDKSLICHLPERCIFPTYETEFPEFMFCGAHPFPPGNRPKVIFNYLDFQKSYSSDSLTYFISSKTDCDSYFIGTNLTAGKMQSKIDDYIIFFYKPG